jgi:hypothetical protein
MYGRTKAGQLVPQINPTTGKIAQPSLESAKGNMSDYQSRHADLTRMYMQQHGLNQTKADAAATQALNAPKTKTTSKVQITMEASKMAKDALGSPGSYNAYKNGGKSYQQAYQDLVDTNYNVLTGRLTEDEAGSSNPSPTSVTPSSASPVATPQNLIPPVSKLKAGQITKFKNGASWTLDDKGQPKRVN